MFRSLRVRIAASHAVVLLVILVVLGVALQFLLARSLDAAVTNELRTSSLGVADRIAEDGRAVTPPDSDVPSDAATQIAVYAAPSDTLVGERRETPSWLAHYPIAVTDLQVGGEPVRVVVEPAQVNGITVAWVVAGRSLLAEDDLVHRVRMLLLAGGAVAVGVSMAAGWWLAGRAVRPVERAFRAQAEFAADASHELRTPLTFIRQGVEVLAEHDRALGPEVLAEVDYLAALTRRLLDLARTEAGDAAAAPTPFALPAAVASACHRSSRALGISLHLGGSLDDVTVEGDRTGLEAALDAVFENVARHGGGAADVRLHHDAGAAVIEIADHGPGMPEGSHDRAFERFFRADAARARRTGGAGLGLALARALVVTQHGTIALSPTPGGGLTVTIALPASVTLGLASSAP
jgi:two-component system sensor histidine kinase CiaH